MNINGSRFVYCACCNRRGDQIKKIYFRTISKSYNIDSLNTSPRKKTSQPIELGTYNIFKKSLKN